MPQQPRFVVHEPAGPRGRLQALARPLLIIPHALLVGGPFFGLGGGGYRMGALGLLAAADDDLSAPAGPAAAQVRP